MFCNPANRFLAGVGDGVGGESGDAGDVAAELAAGNARWRELAPVAPDSNVFNTQCLWDRTDTGGHGGATVQCLARAGERYDEVGLLVSQPPRPS